MTRLENRHLARPFLNPWHAALLGSLVLAALSITAVNPAKADDVQRANTGANYAQYEHDAGTHARQLMESRASDAEAQTDRAVAAEQDRNLHAAGQDQSATQQARVTSNASTNQ